VLRFTLREHVRAPRERVFQVATDVPNWGTRIGAIERIEMLDPGPVRVGTRFKETRVVFRREATETMTVVALEPPQRFALAAQSCGSRYHTEFRFVPRDGGTEVEWSFQAQPLTLIARVSGFVLRPLFKKLLRGCARDLQDLKRCAEAAAAGA
jgi:carbon monoxide dehydrogenase subunit G